MQIDIRCRERDILRGIQEWARRRVLFAIGQFGSRVRAVRVQIDDENGPKGGIDQRCLMEARLLGGGTIIALPTSVTI